MSLVRSTLKVFFKRFTVLEGLGDELSRHGSWTLLVESLNDDPVLAELLESLEHSQS